MRHWTCTRMYHETGVGWKSQHAFVCVTSIFRSWILFYLTQVDVDILPVCTVIYMSLAPESCIHVRFLFWFSRHMTMCYMATKNRNFMFQIWSEKRPLIMCSQSESLLVHSHNKWRDSSLYAVLVMCQYRTTLLCDAGSSWHRFQITFFLVVQFNSVQIIGTFWSLCLRIVIWFYFSSNARLPAVSVLFWGGIYFADVSFVFG